MVVQSPEVGGEMTLGYQTAAHTPVHSTIRSLHSTGNTRQVGTAYTCCVNTSLTLARSVTAEDSVKSSCSNSESSRYLIKLTGVGTGGLVF